MLLLLLTLLLSACIYVAPPLPRMPERSDPARQCRPAASYRCNIKIEWSDM